MSIIVVVTGLSNRLVWFCGLTLVVELLGIPNLITADMIKEGAAVIDVGINRVIDPVSGKSRLVGDVDFEGRPGLNQECDCREQLVALSVF